MTAGERVVPVVKVGAIPSNAQLVEPGGAEFGFKTLAEIAFGLRVQVDASSCIHGSIFVGSVSCISSGFGFRNGSGCGVAANVGLRRPPFSSGVATGRCAAGAAASFSQ